MAEERYRAFLAIVDTGSISKAAQMMNYTQSGISYLIKSLEEDLGFELFTRTKNGADLTEHGELVLPYIKRLVQASDVLLDISMKDAKLRQGVFMVGAFKDATIGWIPDILTDFKHLYPNVRMGIYNADHNKLLEALHDGIISCAITSEEPEGDLDWELLTEDPYYTVLPEGHRLAGKESLAPAELASECVIEPDEANGPYLEQIVLKMDYPPNDVYEVDDDIAAVRMVAAGHGISLLPELCLKYCPKDGIVAVPLEGISRRIYFVTLKEGHASPTLNAFRGICTARYQNR
jgi:DNA-binding transcriptional LysR family regulator